MRQVYKSAHATAMSTRDYSRVIALANVGFVAGSGYDGKIATGWKSQEKLIAQCQRMGDQAVWWRFLRKHHVPFDQKLFDDGRQKDKASPVYAQSLIPSVIGRLLTTMKGCDNPVPNILELLSRYADTFGLKHQDMLEAYIEYLLSIPGESDDGDVRLDLVQVEMSVKHLIPLVHLHLKQASILRRCVQKMEKDDRASSDYDRQALVLSLYLDSLYSLRGLSPKVQRLDQQILEAEIEAIDRRCDALAILSSVFEGEEKCDRPSFPAFFTPLPADFSHYSRGIATSPCCGILGNCERTPKLFDPLEALQGVLLQSHDGNKIVTALAPLSHPLGLSSGHLHARFLMDRFQWASQQGSTMPSFEEHVLPVFSRIQSSGDKAALAEWCSSYFASNDADRLECLEVALNCAIKYSSETEQRKNRYSRSAKDPAALNVLAQEEMKALERVQRISRAKSCLSDRITITRALKKGPQDGLLSCITEKLHRKLDQLVWKAGDGLAPPELLVEALLNEASLLAANHSVDNEPLSMRQFRIFSSVVSDACLALSEDHSHIHIGNIARSIVRGWLFQGDDYCNGRGDKLFQQRAGVTTNASKPSKPLLPEEHKEEDTINFVMDLSTIPDEDQLWHEDTRESRTSAASKVTSDEERSALRKSERELSEEMTVRVALRVAFVLSCNDARVQIGVSESVSVNEDRAGGVGSKTNVVGKGKTGGLLARIEKVGTKPNAYVMECARDLLQVVFARPELQYDSRFLSELDRQLTNTVTFSMRHRSLRAAAVLVPQEALEKVVAEEGYFGPSEGTCSLAKCAFGAFVAHECEQIGMPLTNSDLGHISSIHFSSYARTLWRHHRDGDVCGSRGRLLLLLLEMTLRYEAEIDAAFVELLLKEMGRLNLSRTTLLACEALATLKDGLGMEKYDRLLATCNGEVTTAILASLNAILSELQGWPPAGLGEQYEADAAEAVRTVSRLGRVVFRFSTSPDGQNQLRHFILALADSAATTCDNKLFANGLGEILLNALRHISDLKVKEELAEKIRTLPRLSCDTHLLQ